MPPPPPTASISRELSRLWSVQSAPMNSRSASAAERAADNQRWRAHGTAETRSRLCTTHCRPSSAPARKLPRRRADDPAACGLRHAYTSVDVQAALGANRSERRARCVQPGAGLKSRRPASSHSAGSGCPFALLASMSSSSPVRTGPIAPSYQHHIENLHYQSQLYRHAIRAAVAMAMHSRHPRPPSIHFRTSASPAGHCNSHHRPDAHSSLPGVAVTYSPV